MNEISGSSGVLVNIEDISRLSTIHAFDSLYVTRIITLIYTYICRIFELRMQSLRPPGYTFTTCSTSTESFSLSLFSRFIHLSKIFYKHLLHLRDETLDYFFFHIPHYRCKFSNDYFFAICFCFVETKEHISWKEEN